MILNRQRGIRVSIGMLDQFATRACKLLCLPADAVTVCLVTDREMARWNHAYRQKRGPTDVLSFPFNPRLFHAAMPGKPNGRPTAGKGRRSARLRAVDGEPDAAYLGDIAIAPSVARRNALRFGRTLEDEMRILILHGMLHLMGYDHETDSGQMDRRERSLRRSLALG